VRFNERKDFLTDPDLIGQEDVAMHLGVYQEYCERCSPRPAPKFFEVDRSQRFDQLWHTPIDRLKFSREIEIPCLSSFDRPKWMKTRKGVTPQRFDRFIIAHETLREKDYFPMRGDQVYWNGYRYTVLNVVLEPNAYLGQTNQWMGLVVEAVIPPEGDMLPAVNPGKRLPSEVSTTTRAEP
jgi:hypothetical protein